MCLRGRQLVLASVAVAVLLLPSEFTLADETSTLSGQKVQELEQAIRAQDERIAEQGRWLAEQMRLLREQQDAIERQRRELDALRAGSGVIGGAQYIPAVGRIPMPDVGSSEGSKVIPAQGEQAATPPDEVPVPEEQPRPEIPLFAEVGGVLTPEGSLSLEPAVQYSHSSINRFVFQGIEILDVVLIGDIEASDADRDIVQVSGTARYGVTDRLGGGRRRMPH